MPSSTHSKPDPVSEVVNVNVASGESLGSPGAPVIVTTGGVVSGSTTISLLVESLAPSGSVTVSVTVNVPGSR